MTVRSYEGSELAFDETIRGQADDSMRMRHYLKDRTLVIQFCAPRQSVFRSANSPVKTLEVLVPESLAARMDEAEISVASASIQVSGITADKLEIDSVSGSTDITDTSCRSFELDTVSGSVRSSGLTAGSAETDSVSGPVQLEGSFGKIQYDTISGSFRAGSAICPERIEGSSVSGGVHITIPENDGFTADYDRVSGDFSSDFPTTGDKGRRVYKDGGAASPSIPSAATSPSSADDHGKTPGAHDCAPGVFLFSKRPSIEGAGRKSRRRQRFQTGSARTAGAPMYPHRRK